MNRATIWMTNVSIKIINIIAIIGICVITVLLLFYRLHMALNNDSKVIYTNTLLIIPIIVLVVLLFVFAGRIIRKYSEKRIFTFFSIIYIVASFFLVLNVDSTLRADQELIHKHALLMNQGNYEGLLNGHYLAFNPVQLGFASYVRLFCLISENPVILFVLNIIWTFLIYLMIWKISTLIIESELCRKYVIIFEFAFLPTFFMILYAYGQVPGLSCMLICSYFFIKYLKYNKVTDLMLFIVVFILACILKNNYMIAGIVYGIVILLYVIENKRRLKMLVIIPIIVIGMTYPSKIITNYYRSVSGIDFDDGEPISSYFAMGLHWNEYAVVGGGYDGYTFDNYTESDYNTSIADTNAKEDIKNTLNIFINDPYYAYTFFKYKLIGTWCEPLFGAVECGPLEFYGQYTHNIFIQSIYTDGYLYLIAERYMLAYNIIIFILSAAFLIRKFFLKKVQNIYEIMPALYFIGGFLFHLISETQARYMSVYMVPLILYAAVMFAKLFEKYLKI